MDIAVQKSIDLGRNAMVVALLVSAPLLVSGLVVGVLISLFQAVTQIHEMTLTFIPKIAVVGLVMMLTLPWMLKILLSFTVGLFKMMPYYFHTSDAIFR